MRRLDEAGPRRERHFADRFWSGCRAPIRFRYNDCMRRWELTVALDPGKDQPLFLQLATAIADDIRRGRLQPGDPLPGTRELARSLGLNRNTVVAGYDELLAEGLVRTRTGGGTFVADPVPGVRDRNLAPLRVIELHTLGAVKIGRLFEAPAGTQRKDHAGCGIRLYVPRR